MKIFYANDTSSEAHVGCKAVSNAHFRLLAAAGATLCGIASVSEGKDLLTADPEKSVENLIDSTWGALIEESDAVVVNGEGTIHHGRGRLPLAFLAAGQKLGKETYLVNALVDGVSAYKDIFPNLTAVSVRDPESKAVVRKLGATRIYLRRDSFFEADFVDEPTCSLRGEIVVGDAHPEVLSSVEALEDFGKDTSRWMLEDPQRVYDWQHALANLQGAEVYVTGRYHGVCLAALAGVPFVPVRSNSRKIESLLHWSGCDIPICANAEEIARQVEVVDSKRPEYERFFEFVKRSSGRTHLDAIFGEHLSLKMSDANKGLSPLARAVRSQNQVHELIRNSVAQTNIAAAKRECFMRSKIDMYLKRINYLKKKYSEDL